jgi:hypothetical protein
MTAIEYGIRSAPDDETRIVKNINAYREEHQRASCDA